MNVRELMDILGQMDQDLDVYIYVMDELYGMGFEPVSTNDVAVRNGRVEFS